MLTDIIVEKNNNKNFPFSLPIFKNGLKLHLSSPITFILGDNGSGKSTLLESIAYKVGFNVLGGNRNHSYSNDANYDNVELSNSMKLSWSLKTSKGFFFRAESFLDFSGYLDNLARETGSDIYGAYGGRSLQKQSHGEAFLSLFQNKFREGIFILDEPEAALSAEKQLALISIIHELASSGKCQFIIATHSPLLIATPNSTIYEIEDGGLEERKFDETKQFQLYKSFVNKPEYFLKKLCN